MGKILQKAISLFSSKTYKHFLFYELSVTIILVLCFGWMYVNDKVYVYLDIGADTYSQYLPQYTFARYFFSEGAAFWSSQIGLGKNVFDISSFLFDPFNVFLLPFSAESIEYGILLATISKYYVVSALAYGYLKQFGYSDKAVSLVALCYTFCGFFVSWGQHYHFATAFVGMTFCVYAFERYIRTHKWLMFTFSIAILASLSTYFAYMVFLFLGIYALFRYFIEYRFTAKSFFSYVIKLLLYVVFGVGISAIIFLPKVYLLLNSARVNGKAELAVTFCDPMYYFSQAVRLFSDSALGTWDYYGAKTYFDGSYAALNFYEMPFLFIGVIACLLVPVGLFGKKLLFSQKLAIVTVVFSLVFPSVSGPIFNGFSIITMRWTMVLVPVLTVVMCRGLEFLFEDISKYIKYVWAGGVSASVVLLFCLLVKDSKLWPGSENLPNSGLVIPLVLLFLYGGILWLLSKSTQQRTVLPALLSCVLIVDLTCNAFTSICGNRTLISSQDLLYQDATIEAVSWLDEYDDGFFRIEKNYRKMDLADSLAQSYFGEKMYSSTYTEEFQQFIDTFSLRYSESNYFFGFDDKQALRDLLQGRYFFTKQKVEREGYRMLTQVDDVWIYENVNCVPLGYLQSAAISHETLVTMSRQDALNALYWNFLTDDVELLEKYRGDLNESQKMNYESLHVTEVRRADGTVERLLLNDSNEQSLLLRFEVGDVARYSNSIQLIMKDKQHISLPVYCNSVQNGIAEIYVDYLNIEEILFDDTAISGQVFLDTVSSDAKTKQIEYLQATSIQMETYEDDYLAGSVTTDSHAMMIFGIPFDEGWSAYIDGEKVETHLINVNFLGVEVPDGEHYIELVFVPVGYNIGTCISVIALIVTLVLYVVTTLYKKSKSSTDI